MDTVRAPREFTAAENQFVAAMIEAGSVLADKITAEPLRAAIEDAVHITAVGWQHNLPGAIECAHALRLVILAHGEVADADLANLPE